MKLQDMTDANLKQSLLDAETSFGRDSVEARILGRELTRRNSATQVRTVLASLMQVLDFQGGRAVTGVATGLSDLDDRTRGLQPGDLIVLAARPSVGKSALALNIAGHVAITQEERVAFFSLKMSKDEVALRLLSSRARADGQKLRKGMLSNTEAQRVRKAGGPIYEAPLFIDDSPGLTMEHLTKSIEQKSPRLVVVDSVNLMEPFADDTPYTRVARLSHQLKYLARQIRLPILVTAEIGSGGGSHADCCPDLNQIRESGALVEDADVVLLLDRKATRFKYGTPEYNEVANEADLYIAKQRNGPTGLIRLRWMREFTQFEDYWTKAQAINDT